MIKMAIAITSLVVGSSAAISQSASADGKISGTGRELYVACFLLAADAEIKDQVKEGGVYILPYSPPACLTTAVALMKIAPPGKPNPGLGCYEIKGGPLTMDKWPDEMARMYVQHYEKNTGKLADKMGITALLVALTQEWPCK